MIEPHAAAYFYCPRCEVRTWVRLVTVEGEDHAVVSPVRSNLGCSRCGYRLTPLEAMDVIRGGECLSGWWFMCAACGKDRFVDVVIREEHDRANLPRATSERPPGEWACEHRGRMTPLGLAE